MMNICIVPGILVPAFTNTGKLMAYSCYGRFLASFAS
jgi:hypothetical protein